VCIFTTQLPPEKISRHGAVARWRENGNQELKHWHI